MTQSGVLLAVLPLISEMLPALPLPLLLQALHKLCQLRYAATSGCQPSSTCHMAQ